jgi:threonine/homoserine/homoserine lactone efflux protein
MSDLKTILGSVSLVGGLYVLYLAYESVRAAPIKIDITEVKPHSFKKGILINLFNPHPYLFWMTVGAPLIINMYGAHPLAPGLFLISFFMLIVGSKMLLAYIAGKSSAFLSGRGYIYVMRLLSCLLVIFSLFLFKDALRLLGVWG